MTKLQVINNASRRTGGRACNHRVARRGNALVLAAGILALLVIIATAYVTRTQVERSSSVAVQRAEMREADANDIARFIAGMLAEALFVRPINDDDPLAGGDPAVAPIPPGPVPASSNWPRLPISVNAIRYGSDIDLSLTPQRIFAYNHAPYAVAPYTNWPDKATLDFLYGPPSFAPPIYDDYRPPHGDRVGNPGFGDNRWLRDSEPMRMAVDDPTPDRPNSGDELVVFVQWLHMSNIATAENGIRIITDASDIHDHVLSDGTAGQDGIGLLAMELNFSVEQFLPPMWNPHLTVPGYDYLPANTGVTGPAVADLRDGGNPSIITDFDLPNGNNEFLERWARWLLPHTASLPVTTNYGYPNQLRGLGPLGIPGNYYKLNDLDGNGIVHDWVIPTGGVSVPQDTPEAEFVPGTARHTVSRVLCDADGDGFTDSFWFLLPSSSVAGTRTMMGACIVDNAGKLNLNAASKFEFADQNLDAPGQAFDPTSTITGSLDQFRGRTASAGQTPSDLAVVGGLEDLYDPSPIGPAFADPLPANYNVGIADNPLHQEANWGWDTGILDPFGAATQAYNIEMWRIHETGTGPALRYMNFLSELGVLENSLFQADHELRTQADRLLYWRSAASRVFSPWADRTALAIDGTDLTPFTLADEIDLRMFAGQNQPWTVTRFERAMQFVEDPGQILRTSVGREESSEYIEQLKNVEMVRDLRDKITLFSSTRNDLLPPWLWWEPQEILGNLPLPQRISDLVLSYPQLADQDRVRNNFFAQTRQKLDLRDGISTAVDPQYFEAFVREGELSFHERLPYMFQLALIDFNEGGTYESDATETKKTAAALAANVESYRSGPYVDPADPSITTRGDELQYPDAEDEQFIPIALGGTGEATPRDRANRAVLVDPDAAQSDRYLGMESQPFILEVFLAHVYVPAVLSEDFEDWYLAQDAFPSTPTIDVPFLPPGGFPPGVVPVDPDPGDELTLLFAGPNRPWVDDTSDSTTIVVVQIANPFTEYDESGVPFDQQGIDLNDYAIRLFGQTLRIDSLALPDEQRFLKPATEERPRSAVFHMITNESFGSSAGPLPDNMIFPGTPAFPMFKHRWMDFLDLPQVGGPTPTAPADSKLFVSPFDQNDRAIVIDVNPEATQVPPSYSNPWSTLRSAYDNYATSPEKRAVELLRKVTYPNGRVEWVIVDRTGAVDASGDENDEFTHRASELPQPPVVSGQVDWSSDTFNGVHLVKGGISQDYWVPWVRMTRAWGFDYTFDPAAPDDDGDAIFGELEDSNTVFEQLGIQASERAPRFVFGREFVSKADSEPETPTTGAAGATQHSDMYHIDADPGTNFVYRDPDTPWFDKRQARYEGSPPLELRRKPFFLSMNPVYVPDNTGWQDPVTGNPDSDTDPDDVYLPFNFNGTVPIPGGATVRQYGNFFWYVDVANPSQPAFPAPVSIPATQNPGSPGAGIPSKGLLEAPTGAVLSTGAEPTDGNPVAFRNYFAHSLQMNQKDRDFEQVGELFNLWLHGLQLGPAVGSDTVTALSGEPSPQNIWDTKVTFAERMGQIVGTDPGTPNDPGPRVNRLSYGPVIGDASATDLESLNHAVPALPAGLRVFDAFVCDGPGRDAYLTDFDGDGAVALGINPTSGLYDGTVSDLDDFITAENRAFRNAQGFSGAGTPGLLNLNTSTIEPLRSLPQNAAIVNELPRLRNVPTSINEPSEFVRSDNYLADALMYYRDCYAALPPNAGDPPTQQWEPTYVGLNTQLDPPTGMMDTMRSGYGPSGDPPVAAGIRDELGFINNLANLHGERGFHSIGEAALAVNLPNAPPATYLVAPPVGEVPYRYRWGINMLGQDDVDLVDPSSGTSTWPQTPIEQRVSAALSVDTTKIFDTSVTEFVDDGQMVPDRTAKDNEELNMLFTGMSNLVSTRSDMFTVYLKVRTFRQDPATGRWDATKKENILDDSRYVMLVDRSNVNKPGDQPRILYFEKLPK